MSDAGHAALLSLKKNLDNVLFPVPRIFLTHQHRSLYSLVIYLLNFNRSNSATKTEISKAVRKALFLIEGQSNIFAELKKHFRVISYAIPSEILMVVVAQQFGSYTDKTNDIFFLVANSLLVYLVAYTLLVPFFIVSFLRELANSEELAAVLDDFNTIVSKTKEVCGDPDMCAHAELISLRQILDYILASRGQWIYHVDDRADLGSLHDMVTNLLGFLRTDSFTTAKLLKIRDAAYEAEIAIILYLLPPKFGLLRLCMLMSDFLMSDKTLNFFLRASSVMMSVLCILPQEILFCCEFLVLFCVNFAFYMSSLLVVLLHQCYSKAPKHQVLPQKIDDFSMVMRKVIEDARIESDFLAASSRPDLGGTGRTPVVVGLNNDLIHIKARMLQSWSRREIIPIVGMGGMGKTTLATQVYNDPDILHHFDIRAWVNISREYSLRHVLLSLLGSAEMLTQEMQEYNDNKLAVYLHKILMGRRYLIAMDDVWHTRIWDFMSRYFPENYNGSCVLLTSRMSDVASYPDSSSPLHQMQFLNEDNSWLLLRRTVFGAEVYPFELESIGREIARRCRGLPLAISVVGGLIFKDNRTKIWKGVAENLIHSESKEITEQCWEILGLSYNHLPLHLRPCFLYMGVFPRDYEIPISRLINLWIAEGFLGSHTSTNLEELGELYLEDLIDRNLILVCKRSCTGKIKTCSIHDILWDVCVQKAKEQNFFHVAGLEGYGTRQMPDESTPRLSIHSDALHVNSINSLMSSYHPLRSLLCIASKLIRDHTIAVSSGFKFLRVLYVLEVHFNEFPHQIIKLGLLRYLAFHYDGIFPSSISKLKNLQTIVHHHCSFGKYPLYPMVIWSMPNLRHIYVRPGYDLSQFLWGLSCLVHLQTLVGVRNMKWRHSTVRRILNLKKLVISYDVSSSVDWSRYKLECLAELHQLESLKIAIVSTISNNPPKLEFPQKLKKLSLSGCGIPWAEMSAVGALPNLEALKLRHEAFCGHSWETVNGEFRQLKFLMLEDMCFASWETDKAHFPCLRRLVIRSCGALEELPSCVGDIPTLEMIQLIHCLPSSVDSAKLMQEEQESMGNVDLKLHILG